MFVILAPAGFKPYYECVPLILWRLTFLLAFGGGLFSSSLSSMTTSFSVSRICFRYARSSDSIVIPPIGLEEEQLILGLNKWPTTKLQMIVRKDKKSPQFEQNIEIM